MNNEELTKIAWTRELTDERVRVAAAYWLDASPHERIEADGIILARYARMAMEKLELAVKALEEAKERFDDFRRNWDCDSDAHKYNTPCRVCESEKSRDLINSTLEEIKRLREGVNK